MDRRTEYLLFKMMQLFPDNPRYVLRVMADNGFLTYGDGLRMLRAWSERGVYEFSGRVDRGRLIEFEERTAGVRGFP